MELQNQIKRTLSQDASIEYLINLLKIKTISHRTELAKLVCKYFDFYDARNQMQLGGCLKALRNRSQKDILLYQRHNELMGKITPVFRKSCSFARWCSIKGR
jgi:hypothetical protein